MATLPVSDVSRQLGALLYIHDRARSALDIVAVVDLELGMSGVEPHAFPRPATADEACALVVGLVTNG